MVTVRPLTVPGTPVTSIELIAVLRLRICLGRSCAAKVATCPSNWPLLFKSAKRVTPAMPFSPPSITPLRLSS